MQSNGNDSRVFRIDRFVVPAAGEAEFLQTVAETNTAFDSMEGCLQRDGSTYITIVEWASFAAIQKAREAAAAKHREMNLNPQEMFERLQIKAELGNYVPVGSA